MPFTNATGNRRQGNEKPGGGKGIIGIGGGGGFRRPPVTACG
jgi:hypothetical protein